MRFRVRFLVFTFFSVLIASAVQAKKQETGFLDRTVIVQGTSYKYQVYVPENWSPKQKWPVMLFLHGAGERADDGLIQTQVGIGQAIREHRYRFPAVVVMPQCSKDHWWTQSVMSEMAIAALNAASKEFRGDG